MDPGLADAAVRAAYAYVLVAATESTHGVPLKVRQGHHGIVVQQILAHGHLLEPLAAFHWQEGRALCIHDIHRAEGPAIYLESLAMLFSGVAVTFVIGICFDNVRVRQIPFHQGLHPFAGDDVRAVLLARMQFDTHAAFDLAIHLLISLDEAFC